MSVFVLVLISYGAALAHMPSNGVYPTTAGQWEECCSGADDGASGDCYATPVEVRSTKQPGIRLIVTPVGNFRIREELVHQVTQPGAQEHICVLRGEVPQPDGANVLCVFPSFGLQ